VSGPASANSSSTDATAYFGLDSRIVGGAPAVFDAQTKLLPSQWAEQNRELKRGESAKPGKWSNAFAPVMATVINLPFVCPQVREENIIKAVQIGASEGMRAMVGSIAHQEPDPAMLTLPDKDNGKRIFAKRILPLFTNTKALRGLQTDLARDKKNTEITLNNGFSMRLAWSGSPASMASDPIRFAFNDEVDKYQISAKEADPIKLVEARTTTYETSLIVNWSTPTIGEGLISQLYENSQIKLFFFAPCPHCGTFQQLVWDRLKWEQLDEKLPRLMRAAIIEQKGAAWYECEGCPGKIFDHHRAAMLNAGYLGTADSSFKLFVDGRHEGRLPAGTKVGIRIHALHSLMAGHRFPKLAAAIIDAGSDPAKVRHVRNNLQGEAYEQQIANKTDDVFSAKCKASTAQPKLIPPWASRLVMAVDTQKDHFWFVIRAWGYRFRSRRIHHGQARTFKELIEIAFASYYRFEGDAYPPQCCYMMGIDSGGGTFTENEARVNSSRTDEVYQFANSDINRIKALKGSGEQPTPFRVRAVDYQPPDRRRTSYRVFLHELDRGFFQDLLDAYVTGKVNLFDPNTGEAGAEVDMWELNSLDDPDYNKQLASTHKVKVPKGRSVVEMWRTKTVGAADHLRDCEVYQIAMAHGPARCGELPPEHVLEQQRKASQQATRPMGIKTPDGRPFLATQRR
jgi:phage terminase large subunit GpA-like protein